MDYELLRQIDALESTNQRALAQRMGVSVGKVNYCLKAVMARGWVKMNNFRRADNKWAYAYLLTPSGAIAKMQLARIFLERKEQEFERLRSDIDRLRVEVERESLNAEMVQSDYIAAKRDGLVTAAGLQAYEYNE